MKNLNGSEAIHEYFLINTHTKWRRTNLRKSGFIHKIYELPLKFLHLK